VSAFAAPPFTFHLDDGFTPLALGNQACELAVEDLDLRLVAAARLPVGPGPALASWLLARLAHLAGDLGLGPEEEVEDAVWILDFIVAEGGAPVAKLQLQAGAIGAGLLGVARGDGDAARVVAALVAVLTAAPEGVAPVRVRVAAPGGPVHEYGFDGARYLGG
jgi:hypothetical protein